MPSPTFCPECRLQRKFIFRNYHNFYKRKCDLCGRSIISNYSPQSQNKVYCQKCWWSDKWDPFDYGAEPDFSKPFFEQFRDYEKAIPVISLMNDDGIGSTNCEYTYDFAEGKNCYLVFTCWNVENSFYCYHTNYVKELADSLGTHNSQLSYETVRCDRCYGCSFVYFCRNSQGCHFCYDLRNCSNCFLSAGLRNKNYYILNKSYSREEYQKILDNYHLDTFRGQQQAKSEFLKVLSKSLRRPAQNSQCVNAVGDDLRNCKNVYDVFAFNDVIDSKFLAFGDTAENCYDAILSAKIRRCYEVITADRSHLSRFSILSWSCSDIFYSNYCHNSSHLFACIGLRNKQYCILNKQYTKQEYEQLVPRIIQQMNDLPYQDKKGRTYRYGEFFPSELSPFCYNETIAQEYFPLTRQQALDQGYTWKDPEPRNYQTDIKTDQLPDNIRDVKDDIIGKVIECSHQGQCNEQCTEAFRIIEPELQFYRRMNLPLPRLCPNCRHYGRLKQRNPLKLWTRQCMCQGQTPRGQTPGQAYQNTSSHQHGDNPCPNTFQTSYAPDRPEIVYCEGCYLREVV